MPKHSLSEVRAALEAVGHDAGMQILASAGGVAKLSLLSPDRYSPVIDAVKAHAARAVTAHGDAVDPFQQRSKENNEAAEQYWNDRKAAEAANEPVPALPADRFSEQQIEKLGRERADFEQFVGNNGDV